MLRGCGGPAGVPLGDPAGQIRDLPPRLALLGRADGHVIDRGLRPPFGVAIRERAEIAYVMEDGEPSLRPGGALSIWRVVEQAINEMGWRISRGEH